MNLRLEEDIKELASVEEFLDYFVVPYDAHVVRVKRLHILQRFHDYLARHEANRAADYDAYRRWLVRAYQDLLHSDAQTEKVFAVFQRSEGTSFMPLERLLG